MDTGTPQIPPGVGLELCPAARPRLGDASSARSCPARTNPPRPGARFSPRGPAPLVPARTWAPAGDASCALMPPRGSGHLRAGAGGPPTPIASLAAAGRRLPPPARAAPPASPPPGPARGTYGARWAARASPRGPWLFRSRQAGPAPCSTAQKMEAAAGLPSRPGPPPGARIRRGTRTQGSRAAPGLGARSPARTLPGCHQAGALRLRPTSLPKPTRLQGVTERHSKLKASPRPHEGAPAAFGVPMVTRSPLLHACPHGFSQGLGSHGLHSKGMQSASWGATCAHPWPQSGEAWNDRPHAGAKLCRPP